MPTTAMAIITKTALVFSFLSHLLDSSNAQDPSHQHRPKSLAPHQQRTCGLHPILDQRMPPGFPALLCGVPDPHASRLIFEYFAQAQSSSSGLWNINMSGVSEKIDIIRAYFILDPEVMLLMPHRNRFAGFLGSCGITVTPGKLQQIRIAPKRSKNLG